MVTVKKLCLIECTPTCAGFVTGEVRQSGNTDVCHGSGLRLSKSQTIDKLKDFGQL